MLTVSIFAAGCNGPLADDAGEDDAEAAAAVTVSNTAGTFSIDAPPGDYTSFSLGVSCGHEGPGDGYWVWSRARYDIETNLDCLDCFLPAAVVLGQPVDEHEVTACLPSDVHVGCEQTADASGIALTDLLKPATLEDGEQVPPLDDIDVMFLRVHEAWDDDLADQYGVSIAFPRVDSASATLSVASDGVVSVGSNWRFCEDALNSNQCL